MYLFLWMQGLMFSSHYSSFYSHMILQKSFEYADLMLKKYFTPSQLKIIHDNHNNKIIQQ